MTPATPATTYQAVFDGWCHEHNIRVQWLPTYPDGGIGPNATWKPRRVTLYRFTVGDPEERLAEAAHEVGHLMSGPCPRRPPHQRRLMLLHMECIACEVLATREAERLVRRAGLDWTRTMHDRLSRGLRSYRRTPAPAAELQALHTLASDGRYAAQRQERATRELAIAEIHAIASAPRYVSREARERQRRLEQWAEIQRIGCECRTGATQ